MTEGKAMTVPPRGPLTIRNRESGIEVTLPALEDGVSYEEAQRAGAFLRRAGFTDLPVRKLGKLLERMPEAELTLFAALMALMTRNPSGEQVGTRRRVLEACGYFAKLDSAAYRPMILSELYQRQLYRGAEPASEAGATAASYEYQDRNAVWTAGPPA